MLFKAITHLIQPFPAVKLNNPVCDTIEENYCHNAWAPSVFLEGDRLPGSSERPNQRKLETKLVLRVRIPN